MSWFVILQVLHYHIVPLESLELTLYHVIIEHDLQVWCLQRHGLA